MRVITHLFNGPWHTEQLGGWHHLLHWFPLSGMRLSYSIAHCDCVEETDMFGAETDLTAWPHLRSPVPCLAVEARREGSGVVFGYIILHLTAGVNRFFTVTRFTMVEGLFWGESQSADVCFSSDNGVVGRR